MITLLILLYGVLCAVSTGVIVAACVVSQRTAQPLRQRPLAVDDMRRQFSAPHWHAQADPTPRPRRSVSQP